MLVPIFIWYLDEFSLFLCVAVAKALREVAESKARAKNEAAEWKRKYELERLRNCSLERGQQQELEPEQEQEQCQSPPGS